MGITLHSKVLLVSQKKRKNNPRVREIARTCFFHLYHRYRRLLLLFHRLLLLYRLLFLGRNFLAKWLCVPLARAWW